MSYNKSVKRVATYARKELTMDNKMNIKLNGKNAAERIKAAIDKAQARCRARLICETAPAYAAAQIESRLGIPKKYMDGIVAHVDTWASKFPNAYKGVPESTQFKIENRKGNWYLVDVWRGRVDYPTNYYVLHLPETAQEAIINSFRHFGE